MLSNGQLPLEVLKVLYIFSFSLGLWTCLNLLVHKQGPREVRRALLFFISILLVIPLNGYLSLVVDEPSLWVNSLASTLTWSYSPLMLILVKGVLKKDQTLANTAPHFAPFFIMAGLYLFRLEWLTFNTYLFFLLVQVASYLVVSLKLLFHNRSKVAILGKEFKNSAYYWMLYLLAGLFVIILYDIGLMFWLRYIGSLSFYFVSTTACAFSVYISAMSTLLLLQPDVFTPDVVQDEPEGEAREENCTTKPRNVELSAEAAAELRERLNDLIATFKPHLDSDISLSRLSSLLGVTNHQLSELLNIHMETSFYDFLNCLRYNEAITLMTGNSSCHSLTDIAYLAGFNNRNTFYRVFKENSGLTPGEYRKQNLN